MGWIFGDPDCPEEQADQHHQNLHKSNAKPCTWDGLAHGPVQAAYVMPEKKRLMDLGLFSLLQGKGRLHEDLTTVSSTYGEDGVRLFSEIQSRRVSSDRLTLWQEKFSVGLKEKFFTVRGDKHCKSSPERLAGGGGGPLSLEALKTQPEKASNDLF